ISSSPAPSTRSCRSRTATARNSGPRSTPSCRARRCSAEYLRVRGAFGDQGDGAIGHAGLHKALAIMGEVIRILPAEIPQMPLDGEVRILAEQDITGFCGLL